jgi:DNA mismatch repair protein MutS
MTKKSSALKQQSARLTPMLEQYLRIKEENPNALLFFRMGDFYELFFEDAEKAARELQIALTSRNPNSELHVPMCGVPHHACEEYLRQLLNKGYKVAICDQIEDPKQAKGLVQRAVTRILTPGTVVEDMSLSAKEHNHLASVFWDEDSGVGAAAWADFSTGHWTGLQSKSRQTIRQWMIKIKPREILMPRNEDLLNDHAELSGIINRVHSPSYFDYSRARELLFKTQEVSSLQVLDLEDKPALVRACGSILTYLKNTQKQSTSPLDRFSPMNPGNFLLLDEVSERNLELFRRMDGKKGSGTLLHVMDQTLTPMGGRLLETRLRQPWKDAAPINANQEAVAFFYDRDELRTKMRDILNKVYDLERLSTRIFLNRCTPKDFVSLRQSLEVLPGILSTLSPVRDQAPKLIREILDFWDNLDDVRELLKNSLVDNPGHLITEGGLFRQGFDRELDELIDLTEHGESRLNQLLEKEKQENEIPKLKLGFNKVFGYYLEVSKAHKGSIPAHFERRQTLVSSERYITPQLKELEDTLFSASERRKAKEYELFNSLRQQVAGFRERFAQASEAISRLDYWQALAYAARREQWNRPAFSKDMRLRIESGRHPAIEAVQGRSNYIPNNLEMDDAARFFIITGPNMAGKSTILRQTAIIVIMAQMGSFVPADNAEIGICDRVFSRVGASDNLAMGQSTFMVEMTETARILRQASKRSLIILDEIGRGTSTFDGLSLAWAVAEDLAGRHGGIRTLFATHYHELTALAEKFDSIRNFNVAVKEWKGSIVFLRRMVPGPSDKSYGIEVAKLAGVPSSVVKRAGEILSGLEKKGVAAGKWVRKKDAPAMLPGMEAPRKETQDAPRDPVVKKLKEIDPNGMTPLQALNTLHEWKKKYA